MYIIELINFGELVIGMYCRIVCNLMNVDKTNFKWHGLVPVAVVSTGKDPVTGDLSEVVWTIGDCVDSIFILYLINLLLLIWFPPPLLQYLPAHTARRYLSV